MRRLERRGAQLRSVAVGTIGLLAAIALILLGDASLPDIHGLRWAQKARLRAALRHGAAYADAYAPLNALPVRSPGAPPVGESWFAHFPNATTWSAMKRDVTLVTQVSEGRVQYAGGITARWAGPAVLAIYVADAGAAARVRSEVAALHLPLRITLLWYTANNASAPYPINKLRNAAIAAVRTSHFFLADVDFFPSRATYGLMRALPAALLADARALFTPPAFTTSGANLQERILACTSSACIDRVVPDSAEELSACASLEQCRRFCRPCEGQSTANYSRWQATPAEEGAAPNTKCFLSHRYEPYLLVPATRKTPRFHEGFMGYGKNKIEWVQHLRIAGYSFQTLSREAFVIHVAHRESASNALWKQNIGRIQSRNTNLYWSWMKHLSTRYSALAQRERAREAQLLAHPGPQNGSKVVRVQIPICPGESAAVFDRKIASAAAMLFGPSDPMRDREAAKSATADDEAVVL